MTRTFIPSGEVVPSRWRGHVPVKWLGSDSEQRFRPAPHPGYGVDDIDYLFNSHGYRCAEFDDRGDRCVVTAGSDTTFGTGLPRQATYPAVLERLLSEQLDCKVRVWNLAIDGESNDFISRVLMTAVPVLRPDAVFVNWTELNRREFFTADGKILPIVPSRFKADHAHRLSAVARKILEHHLAIESAYQDQSNFLLNFKLVEYLLRSNGVSFLFTAIEEACLKDLMYALPPADFIGFYMEASDLARDQIHPGASSHRAFAERLAPLLAERLRSDGAL